MILLLDDFDKECKDFSESDKTKLKWIKNLAVLNIIASFSLMSYGVGVDLIGNGVGIINSMLVCGLLLSLPATIFLITAPLFNVVIENSLKKSAISMIEEQFKGDDQLIEVNNEQPSSTINNQSYFPIGQLMLTS